MSDFFDTGFEKPLRALSQRHDVVAVHLQDKREQDLPSVGLIELTDAETGQTVVVDGGSARVRQAFADRSARRQDELDTIFRKLQLDRVLIRTDQGYVDPLIEFFRQRNRAR